MVTGSRTDPLELQLRSAQARAAPRGRTFYFHVETRQSTWEDPSELIMGHLDLEVGGGGKREEWVLCDRPSD
eukprot:Skav203646  [mRNA]  locus=scaffold1120:435701:435916:+ [translate_table: standard]